MRPQATSAVYAGDGPTSFRVAIYAEKLNLRNYWAGSWLSLWQVGPEEGGNEDGQVRITGQVKVRERAYNHTYTGAGRAGMNEKESPHPPCML